MPTRFFCTYFDINYVPRARALHASLRRHAGPFRLYALCHDEASFEAVSRLGDPTFLPISIGDLERYDPELAATRATRNRAEYYFTTTAALCRFVLDRFPEIELLTYLDADLYFYSSPEPIFEELEGASVGIIEHRFRPLLRRYRRFGIYNVGWVSLRRDVDGMACVRWWRDRCIEWCHDRVEGDRYADQKYMNAFPQRFQRVHVVRHAGANVAPWNAANYRFAVSDGVVTVSGTPLVFFHFSGVREIRPWLYRTDFGAYLTPLTRVVRQHVYRPYIAELRRLSGGSNTAAHVRNTDFRLGAVLGRLKSMLRVIRGAVYREFIVIRQDGSAGAGSQDS